MYFKFDLSRMPDVIDMYSVRRRTVWQIVDHNTLFIFVSEGRCRIDLDNVQYTLTPGSLMIIPAGHFYERRPFNNEFCTMFYMHIDFSGNIQQIWMTDDAVGSVSWSSGHMYAASGLTDLSAQRDSVTSLLQETLNAGVHNSFGYSTQRAICAVKLILMIAAETEKKLVPAKCAEPTEYQSDFRKNPKLTEVFAYIREHRDEKISLDDLCSICNFSKQHLIRLFCSEFGMTPKAYILAYKIGCAKELFYQNPYITIKEAADALGFEDPHYFSRLFTKIAGVTPGNFRKHLITFDPDKQ